MRKALQRKYQPDFLIAMFRKAAAFRDDLLAAGFTDNGGAIHSAERILNLLGLRINFPELDHINNLRRSDKAVFSVEARKLYKRGGHVLIEHVSPIRDLTRKAIENVRKRASDAQLKAFVRKHYKLVLLTPAEARRLNKQNRSRMKPDRLKKAGIQLAVED